MKKIKKMLSVLLCLALFCTLAPGCKEQEDVSSISADEYPVTIGGVQLNAPPERVVVLSDNLADVILALGYEIVLKGKSIQCTQSELSVLPDVSLEDLDSLKALDPDLVLVDQEPENADDLAVAGIPVMVILPAQDRSDFERLYIEVGSALKGKTTGATFAQKRAQDIFTSIDDITRSSPSSTIVTTACYLYDLNGNVATGDTLAGTLLTAAGVANAFEGNQSGDVTVATMKIANPNYIFCASGLKEQILASQDYSGLAAVQNGNVYEMDPTYMIRQGRTVLQAVTFIHGIVFDNLEENASEAPGSTSSEESSSSSSVSYTEVKYGDVSDEVMRLQERLEELGYMFVEPTGEFGDATEQAIKDFQLLNNLSATGLADQTTLQAIYSDTAIPRS